MWFDFIPSRELSATAVNATTYHFHLSGVDDMVDISYPYIFFE